MTWLLLTPILAAGTVSEPTAAFFQYGAIGAIAFLGVVFFRLAYKREADRADKLEAEVQRLNQVIQDKYVPALEAASAALQESTVALRIVQQHGVIVDPLPPRRRQT